MTKRVHIIDSHTAGEPTRLIIEGAPHLGNGTMAERLNFFKNHHDEFRSAVVNEPRGSDAVVGALLCTPTNSNSTAGVIFFNNVGYLGMCGHGTIGLLASLFYLERIQPGVHQIETPVGKVSATLHASGEVTVSNVPSFRFRKDVEVQIPGYPTIVGDIAWGGNWFFLSDQTPCSIQLQNVELLTNFTMQIRAALDAHDITGSDGHSIDHIEIFDSASGRNFVLCPGNAYDRSPCGTGTSAKVACLYADGKLQPGETWIQKGILDTAFQASIEVTDGIVYPSITGRAHITADSFLILDDQDPFCWGIRP